MKKLAVGIMECYCAGLERYSWIPYLKKPHYTNQAICPDEFNFYELSAKAGSPAPRHSSASVGAQPSASKNRRKASLTISEVEVESPYFPDSAARFAAPLYPFLGWKVNFLCFFGSAML